MTALFEMRIRLGGDPGSFDEFNVLRGELAKLDHPACPDVDWAKVEALCLRLFERNGVELQTAVSFILARSYRTGLAGLTEGVALLSTLTNEWPRLWPLQASARMDLIAWLFAQLHPLVRMLEWGRSSLATLRELTVELGRLEHRLERLGQAPLASLKVFRQQISNVMQRMSGSRDVPMPLPLQSWASPAEPAPSPPIAAVVSAPPTYTFVVEPAAQKRAVLPWLLTLTVTSVFVGWLGWQEWASRRVNEPPTPEPIQLDSLNLFDPGSAELKPGSTKLLINALVGIKAQPGWLIVISGHADARGEAARNLDLSRARASAVRDWMQRMGNIPDSCFAVQGVAASQPVSSNDTFDGRAENRRVDIRLVPQGTACGELEAGGRSVRGGGAAPDGGGAS
ncbi:OmpA family protein [Pseudomonas putida]|uniref:OmpA family protein n=1 Tax=Pseudomonas putida TaxID=303 RepID=UPI000DB67797|nr:OmpA family protein [Pseudomonas putida]MBI6942743.1 OmpA family protein [Pseudomonas putida]MBI6958790.1 OmpA family protein [Pseudomonas putida]PZQ40193.1 MAG: flagellar motor protein MotB [Pseudomonas putida]